MTEFLALFLPVFIFPGGAFALAFGLSLKGIDRRVAARLQRRVGPPLLQPFFDLIKLSRKETMVPNEATDILFLALPPVGAATMLLAAALIPIPALYAPDVALGNLPVLFYLLVVPGVILMLAGSASGSPYGAIGFSREMMMKLAYEIPIVLVLVAVGLRAGENTHVVLSLPLIVEHQLLHGAFLMDPVMWPALFAFIAYLPANLGVLPFDIPEAETELLDGPLLEYSGPALGLFKIMSALKTVVLLGLGICLFFPTVPENASGITALGIHMTKIFLLVISVTVLRVSMGRMRIDQAFGFFLKWPSALAAMSVIAVVLNW